MAKRYHGSYEGISGRDKQEFEDGAMMPSGAGQMANLPQEVVMRAYPKPYEGMPENINDGLGGIDKQIKQDNSKKFAHLQPEKV